MFAARSENCIENKNYRVHYRPHRYVGEGGHSAAELNNEGSLLFERYIADTNNVQYRFSNADRNP